MRRRSKTPAEPGWLGNTRFSSGQLTGMFVAVCLAVVLVPLGARASSMLGAVITDPGGANKAKVDAGGDLQVAGSVNVGNTPSVNVANSPTVSAGQSGPWNVGITGTPSVSLAGTPSVSVANTPAVTSADTTAVAAHGAEQIIGGGGEYVVFNLDVSAYKEIHLYVIADGFIANDVTFTVYTFSLGDGAEYVIDTFKNDTAGTISKTYDLPGQNLYVSAENSGLQSGTVRFLVLGRSN